MKIQSKKFGFSVATGSMMLGTAVPLNQVDTKAFHHSTGKTIKGQTVKSLHIAADGETVVLKNDAGVTAVNGNDFEIAARDYLSALGYRITMGGGH